jgi:adenylate cyclase
MSLNPPARSRISRRQRKRLYHTLVLLGVGCLFTLVAVLVQPFHSINLWLSDQLFTPEFPSPNIVIAGIDDDTLETYGRWAEWPRSLHAQAIDNLSQAGAKVIGFDVVFANNSPDDEMLATSMASAGNVVLATVGIQPVPQTEPEITYEQFLLPNDSLEQAASNIGHANVIPDIDGTVRRLPLIVKSSSGQIYPAFTLAVLHRLFSMPMPQEYQLRNGTIYLLARDIPVDTSYQLRINFATESHNRPYVSYGDVIRGDFDPSMVKNKIVLIGMTATGEPDTWAIPISASKVPGVFIHAAAMDTILTQRFLIEPGITTTLMIMLLLVGITAFALPWCGTWYWTDIAKGAGITVGLFLAYLIASFLVFDRGYSLDLLYPLLLLPIVYVSNILYMLVIEQSDKRFVKELFGRYISPQVAREVVGRADAGKLDLNGEEREVTVLFADIRNFTQISEQLSPEATVTMLNNYLAVVIDAVVKNRGIINKFAGDNIMAVWNAPQPQSAHAEMAVKAGWEAQQKVAALQQSDNQLLPVQFGIGVNTGRALAGSVGSAGRAEYTVIGDAVNVASRICSATPGGEVWIGAETYRQAMKYVDVEELEPQTFKGKAEFTIVYRVTSCHPLVHLDKMEPR